MLTNCALMPVFGRILTFFPIKAVYLADIVLFEIGSAICGAAPNSIVFILGRAIAGVGSAGLMTGAITIMVLSVPLHKRPIYQGLFGAVFGISSVAGPLLGGAFTDGKATWRYVRALLGVVE